jgi:hypothetical protein
MHTDFTHTHTHTHTYMHSHTCLYSNVLTLLQDSVAQLTMECDQLRSELSLAKAAAENAPQGGEGSGGGGDSANAAGMCLCACSCTRLWVCCGWVGQCLHTQITEHKRQRE